MTPFKALMSAATVAVGLMTMAETASANGRYGGGGYRGGGYHGGGYHGGYRGGYRGPAVSFGFWGGPGYWGPGYWGAGYWGSGYWRGGYWGSAWGPGWGYWGAPVYTSPVVMVQEPQVWVENNQPASTTPLPTPQAAPSNPSTQQWWYWCTSARGYYPYVASCAEGWQRVAPQPVPAQ